MWEMEVIIRPTITDITDPITTEARCTSAAIMAMATTTTGITTVEDIRAITVRVAVPWAQRMHQAAHTRLLSVRAVDTPVVEVGAATQAEAVATRVAVVDMEAAAAEAGTANRLYLSRVSPR